MVVDEQDFIDEEVSDETLYVTIDGSERKVVMRQGNEANAGAKHSLFRHYGTNNGAITVDDILLIPEIIANGERTEKKRGNKTVIEYKHTDNNGVE